MLQAKIILRPFAIAWPDMVDLERYVDIRATLERAGTLISQPDLRMVENHQSRGGRWISAFQLIRISAFTPQRLIAELRSWLDSASHSKDSYHNASISCRVMFG